MATESFVPPSQHNPAVDGRLEQIVLRAVAKRPEDRFGSAKEFADALANYTNGAGGEAVNDGSLRQDRDGGGATIDFLMQRMRIKGDFPALGEAISAINRISSSSTESVGTLTAVILKDVSLTNKLLRMVNTACYKRFGGSISTISRAVAVLGFDAVRNSALSLILFEHLRNSEQRAELRRMMGKGYLASEIARDLSGYLHGSTPEEGAIAAMFFELGKLLVTFYLYEEAQQISLRAAQAGCAEDKAAHEVIGVSFSGLGVAIAKRWGFPDKLVDALARSEGTNDTRRAKDVLGSVADCANALTLCSSAEDFEALARRFKGSLAIPAIRLQAIRETCVERTAADAKQMGLNLAELNNSTAVEQIVSATSQPETAASTEANIRRGSFDGPQTDDTGQRHSVLVAGISDISQTLAGDFELLHVMRIIVETLYRGSSFQRVLLFTKDAAGEKLLCRIGFGPGSETFVSEKFAISLALSRDVFHGCLSRNADLMINDTSAEKIAVVLPKWFQPRFAAQSALLLPLTAQKNTLGLLYLDTLDSRVAELTQSDMELLRTLRSQAVLAMKQSGLR
jgi:HD-like signal output (HDOD) protein